jgi:uncharacterized membrane protein
MTNTQKYLNTFFEEKDLPLQNWEIEHEGMTHFIGTEEVVEIIKAVSDAEQKAIANMLRKIDYLNGDVNHFLKHLATGYIKTNY